MHDPSPPRSFEPQTPTAPCAAPVHPVYSVAAGQVERQAEGQA